MRALIDDKYDVGIEWMQNMPLGFGHNNYVDWSWFEWCFPQSRKCTNSSTKSFQHGRDDEQMTKNSLSYIHASEYYEQDETMASEINNIKADSRCEHEVNACTFVEAGIVQKTPNLDIFHVTLSSSK